MSKEYDLYIKEHKENVKKGYEWIKTYIPNFYNPDFDFVLPSLIEKHDDSKYSTYEYEAYDNYFYGHKNEQVKKEFDKAWLHHIHHNKHHWQHWVLLEDDPETDEEYKCIPMPYVYIVEMICDWWSFSWKTGNLYEIFNWYAKHKNTMKLHPKTKEMVEDLLNEILSKLEEINNE